MTDIQQLFKEHTCIDPDYMLMMILETLGMGESNESLGKASAGIVLIRHNGKITGKITYKYPGFMKIEKIDVKTT